MSCARFHLASVGLWTIVFTAMSGAGGVGDTHRGQWVTFWERACAEDLPNGCRHFAVLVSTYCDRGSGWACNEYGVLVQPAIRPSLADEAFQRACSLGFAAGGAHLRPGRTGLPARSAPELVAYAIVLRISEGLTAGADTGADLSAGLPPGLPGRLPTGVRRPERLRASRLGREQQGRPCAHCQCTIRAGRPAVKAPCSGSCCDDGPETRAAPSVLNGLPATLFAGLR